MLRLTLRTLLAYLDDTLDPAQAKQIGEKVAESEVAQELVERLKKVTRRRRIIAPDANVVHDTEDPNTIAEYLDNLLSSEKIADFEQDAMNNDSLLAEIASSHQILTLVLGEPVAIPQTARRRMYRLVKGPESIPYRKPTESPVAGVAVPEETDDLSDDDFVGNLLGPRSGIWLMSLVATVGLLMFAVWMAVPASPTPTPLPKTTTVAAAKPVEPPANVDPKPKLPEKGIDPKPVDPPLEEKKKPEEKPPEKPAEKKPEENKKAPEMSMPSEKAKGPPEPGPKPRPIVTPGLEPDLERKAIGQFDSPPQPLLVRPGGDEKWVRVDPDSPRLFSTDTFVALPGFRPELKFDSGVRVQLWGNLPEYQKVPVFESSIETYQPRAGFDLDFRLNSGRVFLTTKSPGPSTVRVRFLEEVWDITLPDGNAEVAIDRFSTTGRGALLDQNELAESPRTVVYFGVTKGKASLKVGFRNMSDLNAGTKMKWDNKGAGLIPAPMKDDDESLNVVRWQKTIPNVKDLADSVKEFGRRLQVGRGAIDLELASALKGEGEAPALRVLIPQFLQATDSLVYLFDAIEDASPAVRDAAAKAAQHWCSQSAEREKAFMAALIERKGFTELQARYAVALIRGAAPDKVPAEKIDEAFGLLRNDSLLMRELTRATLAKLDPLGAKESAYDAAGDKREAQATKWQGLFKKRK
jgi:hypothetical protein